MSAEDADLKLGVRIPTEKLTSLEWTVLAYVREHEPVHHDELLTHLSPIKGEVMRGIVWSLVQRGYLDFDLHWRIIIRRWQSLTAYAE